MRPRDAPRAMRVVNSRLRAAPRARNRPATFSDASRSRSSVPPHQHPERPLQRAAQVRPALGGRAARRCVEARNRRRCSAVTRGKPSRRVSSSSIDLNQGWSPAFASSAVTPGLRRPNTCIHRGAPVEQAVPLRRAPACFIIAPGSTAPATSPRSMPRKRAARRRSPSSG